MYAKLTYILTCIACLASACSSDTPDDVVLAKGARMSFDVSNLSRASVTTSFNQFAVYGDINHPADDVRPPVVLFDKTEVNYTDDSWSYEGTQYWVPKYEHSFVAISPLSVLAADNNPQYLNSQLSFTYTIPTIDGVTMSKNSDVTDIIAATHRRLYSNDEFTNEAKSKVTFKFSHILSLINFSLTLDDNIMKDDEYVLFRKIEISGFKTHADFSILPASRQSNSQTDDMVVDVNARDGVDGNLAIGFTEPVKVLNDRKSISLFDSNDAIIMLPQAFAADSQAEILLTYTINGETLTHQLTIPLSGMKWESGKSYNYKLLLDRKGLHSEETIITAWDVIEVGNIDAQ